MSSERLEEYKILVENIRDEANMYWTRFSALFVVCSAFLTAIGFFLNYNSSSLTEEAIVSISIVGFVVSLIWTFICLRAEKIHDGFVSRAVELERVDTVLFPQIYTKLHESLNRAKFYQQVPIMTSPSFIGGIFAVIFFGIPLTLYPNLTAVALSVSADVVVSIAFSVWGFRKKETPSQENAKQN